MSSDPFQSALERAKAIAAKLNIHRGFVSLTSAPPPPRPSIAEEDDEGESTENVVVETGGDDYLALKAPPKTLELMIPSHMTSLVMGRGGETIKMIEDYCKVQIKFGEGKNDEERVCYITGDEANIKDAKSRVNDIVHGNGSIAILYGGNQPGQQTVYVQVPVQRVGLVIGRQGETIKALQDRSGAKINVIKDETENRSSTRSVVVSGPSNCIVTAQQLIHEIVESGTFNGQFGIGENSETVMVPKEKIGLIIGKGGETIKSIQEECKVKLNIDPNADADGERAVTIYGITLLIIGAPEAIAMAREQVLDRVAGHRRRLNEEFDYEFTYTNYSDPSYAAYAPVDQPGNTGATFDATAAYDSNGALQYDMTAYQQYDPKAYAEYYAQYYAAQGYTVNADGTVEQSGVPNMDVANQFFPQEPQRPDVAAAFLSDEKEKKFNDHDDRTERNYNRNDRRDNRRDDRRDRRDDRQPRDGRRDDRYERKDDRYKERSSYDDRRRREYSPR